MGTVAADYHSCRLTSSSLYLFKCIFILKFFACCCRISVSESRCCLVSQGLCLVLCFASPQNLLSCSSRVDCGRGSHQLMLPYHLSRNQMSLLTRQPSWLTYSLQQKNISLQMFAHQSMGRTQGGSIGAVCPLVTCVREFYYLEKEGKMTWAIPIPFQNLHRWCQLQCLPTPRKCPSAECTPPISHRNSWASFDARCPTCNLPLPLAYEINWL